MSPKKQRYCKNPKEIARLLIGKTRRQHCLAVVEWTQRDDFPKKTPKGWTHESLLDWQNRTRDEFAQRKAMHQVFDPEAQLKPSDLKIARETIASITTSAGVASNATASASFPSAKPEPEWIEGLTKLAIYIAEYAWPPKGDRMTCSKQTILEWKKKIPPFPSPTAAGRYQWSACKQWVMNWRSEHGYGKGDDTSELFANLTIERARSEMENIEHERMLRSVERGKYIEKGIIARLATGAGRSISAEINAIEHALPLALEMDLKEMVIPNEQRLLIMEKFRTHCRTFVEKINATCAQRMRELGEAKDEGGE